MSDTTKIEWATHTFNPWEGCTKVSPGCANCYAEARNHRFGMDNWGKGKPRRRTSAATWRNPVNWNQYGVCSSCGDTLFKANRRSMCREYGCDGVYVNPRVFPSLCDWLDDEVPIEWLADFLKLIHDTPNLDWLLLTKRPENWYGRIQEARNYLTRKDATVALWLNDWLPTPATSGVYERGRQATTSHPAMPGEPPDNVWIGVSVEDQKRADERIPELLKIPAAVRFLSVEPLLGAVNLVSQSEQRGAYYKTITGTDWLGRRGYDGPKVDWVIIGGESGAGARPCDVKWIRDIIEDCANSHVPCFVKQLGKLPYVESNGEKLAMEFQGPKGGNMAVWPPDLRVREFPNPSDKLSDQ